MAVVSTRRGAWHTDLRGSGTLNVFQSATICYDRGMTEQNPRWLNSDERRVWLRLSALMELLPAALDAQLQRDADLTKTAYLTWAMLSEEPPAVCA